MGGFFHVPQGVCYLEGGAPVRYNSPSGLHRRWPGLLTDIRILGTEGCYHPCRSLLEEATVALFTTTSDTPQFRRDSPVRRLLLWLPSRPPTGWHKADPMDQTYLCLASLTVDPTWRPGGSQVSLHEGIRSLSGQGGILSGWVRFYQQPPVEAVQGTSMGRLPGNSA